VAGPDPRKLVDGDPLPDEEKLVWWVVKEGNMRRIVAEEVVALFSVDGEEDNAIRDADVPTKRARSILYDLQEEGVVKMSTVTKKEEVVGFMEHHHVILSLRNFRRWREEHEFKRCPSCGVLKVLTDFASGTGQGRGEAYRCLECLPSVVQGKSGGEHEEGSERGGGGG
jgi:hypothetical protein